MYHDTSTTTLELPITGKRRGARAEARAPRALPVARSTRSNTATAAAVAGRANSAVWRIGQVSALAALAALIATLLVAPELALRALWYGLVPLLPATFIVQPKLWRNVCPVATLNMLAGRRSRGLAQSRGAAPWVTAIGISLFASLVPARRFLLNVDGAAVATIVAVIACAALTLGLVFDRKAGFCNAICPMLSVERLYGHAPFLEVGNPRCGDCSLCTARACIDLAGRKTIVQLLGRARRTAAWLATPFGVFAAAFPGFVLGYFLAPHGGLEVAPTVYLSVAIGAAASYALTVAIAVGLAVPASAVIPAASAAAALAFYWFSAADMSRAWRLGAGTTWAIRVAAIGLIGLWIWRQVADVIAEPR